MNENTTHRRFTTMAEFAALAQVGDTLHEEGSGTITDSVVTAIEPGPTDGGTPEAERTVVFDYLYTRHDGRPFYTYRSMRHTRRVWPADRHFTMDLNLGQALVEVSRVPNAKRRSAKGLAAAHAQALTQVALTA